MAENKLIPREPCRTDYPGSESSGSRNSSHSSSDHHHQLGTSSRSPVSLEHAAVSDSAAEDHYTSSLLHQVFDDSRSSSAAVCLGAIRKPLQLSTVDAHISACLKEVTETEMKSSKDSQVSEAGRLGPPECTFDMSTNVGAVVVDPNKLEITSHSNFSSTKANCCVYEGKWVYELMLASKGVMQLGWCTANCKFSQEEGVGDTRDSYAYDGSRLRKWNVTTKKYGEPWMSGDVISCAIDCDEGIITFYRNGVSLGEAFSKVRVGPGYGYFPAVSLSFGESVQANFGGWPLRYPVEGYRPLQSARAVEVAQAELLLTYLHNLLPKMIEDDQLEQQHAMASKCDFPLPALTDQRSHRTTLSLVAAHIFHRLSPLLRIPYVIEMCLVKLMLDLCDHQNWRGHQVYIHKLLDLMWMLMQDPEVQDCLESLMMSLLNGYRFHPFHPEMKYPKKYLALTLAVVKHERTRRHLLTSVLFDRVKFPVFMHIKAPDDPNLARLVPVVWWDKHMKSNFSRDTIDRDDTPVVDAEADQEDEKSVREQFMQSCERLGERVEELESMQVELLKCLLINNDFSEGKTSRDLFIDKLKTFLKENSGFTRPQNAQCSLPVSLCFFHRLVQTLRHYWDELSTVDPAFSSSSEAFMPIQYFWNDARDYHELLRCGGLTSHLKRRLALEVYRAQYSEVQEESRATKKSSKDIGKVLDEYPKPEMPSENCLLEILDSLVLLYHIAAHKQLGKMCALRENMQEFISNMADTEKKIVKCPDELTEVKEHLGNARSVFEEKIIEQARQMVWIAKVIYSPSKQRDIAWLLNVVLRTAEKASTYQKLFQYVPEFYIETAVNTFNALRNFLHPTTPFSQIPNLQPLLSRYATFLVTHFSDSRLVSNDLKDTLVQALACFTCYPDTLKVLEELPMDRRIFMIQSLISPYENRSWAHTNWILVRIWKGCGFGYRYRCLPNLTPLKPQPTEFSFISLQEPCPSQEFQSLLAKILLDDEARSTKFLDSLMNQLNWSLSEFVGITQEIQSLTAKTEPLILEQRQIKICAACFEISVCLLRVLEMVATVAPQVFTDWSRPSAELFLKRLMQILSQIMARVTMKDGAFENTVALRILGLDTVSLYPILSVTVGIMAQLIVRCGGSSQEKATRSLLLDSGFSADSLKFVLGENHVQKSQKDKSFSLKKFDEISAEEIEDVEKLLAFLSHQQVSLTAAEEIVKDEDLCTICYGNPQQAVFVPCGHKSCRTCITQHLLNKKQCFFCISTITRVNDIRGRQILREYFQTPAPKKS
ncbi:hypothetical protein BsWGS_13649 [Bradybaena similaris]